MLDLDSFFSSEGALAKHIPGYKSRSVQLQMAESVAHAIETKSTLIAEAGTGTGKTFAYLIPAILSGKKIIVSTGTKNLQDQLFKKDLPVIRQALTAPFQAALLKGRSNYLCHYRLKNGLNSDVGYSRRNAAALSKISAWSGKTRSGDISELSGVSETSPVWPLVTSNADNCLNQECPCYTDCFPIKARRKAQKADILIINHHLLWADWSVRDSGFGELLPNADVIIVDEAHQLAETASQFLGITVSSRQVNELIKDILTERDKEAADMQGLQEKAQLLSEEITQLQFAFGHLPRRESWHDVSRNQEIRNTLKRVCEQSKVLAAELEVAAERSKGLESCWNRCNEIVNRLANFTGEANENSGDWIQWLETRRNSFTLHRTPMKITHEFQRLTQESKATWIFTSATLTVANRFDHFISGLGLENVSSKIWDSPFDFQNQALFYHPSKLPDPSSSNFIHAVTEAAIPVLRASQGRAFFLFTSHHALRKAAEYLEDKIQYPLLIQGTQPRTVLIERFKKHGHAILLGTASFWEGVDVRGPALSCVIIDKLPFASPSDPVLKARLGALRRQGKDPFNTYQLPAAAIALKQGVGRLIRDVCDTGVLMLCDPRLLKRSYGRVFLDSVPAMKRTRSLQDVQAFFVGK